MKLQGFLQSFLKNFRTKPVNLDPLDYCVSDNISCFPLTRLSSYIIFETTLKQV